MKYLYANFLFFFSVASTVYSMERNWNSECISYHPNRCIKLIIDDTPYVLRMGQNQDILGIDRLKEVKFYKIGEELGLAPRLFAYDSDHQILLSSYIDNFNSFERIRAPEMIRKIVEALHLLHSYQNHELSEPISNAFAFTDALLKKVEALNILSDEEMQWINSWMQTRKDFEQDYYEGMSPGICHGDLYYRNIIEDNHGKIYLLDWEYSYYGYAIDDLGKLCAGNEYSDEEISFVIKEYYKTDDPLYFFKIKQNIFIRQFALYLWSRLQYNLLPQYQDHYKKLADEMKKELMNLQTQLSY